LSGLGWASAVKSPQVTARSYLLRTLPTSRTIAWTASGSTDPLFVEKVVDVVGLYHNPPEKAVVLCVDEKSQVQALDQSQPVLPMMPGIVDKSLPETEHDFSVDLIVTPDELIKCGPPRRPNGLHWDHLTKEKIAAIPVLAMRAAPRRGWQLSPRAL